MAIIGTQSDDTLIGTPFSDLILGENGNDVIYGMNGNDEIYGGRGNDIMVGGAGNDYYHVDSVLDYVLEQAGNASGNDTVFSDLITYTLGDNIENLYLSTDLARTGRGNELDNRIGGTSFNNVLWGLSGNDSLDGYAGQDTLLGGDGNDYLNGGADDDTLYGGAGDDTLMGFDLHNYWGGNDKLYGGEGNDVLWGGNGDDILDGGSGVNTMRGGHGSDTYYVHSVNDKIIEEEFNGHGAPIDTVISFSSYYRIPAYIESLRLFDVYTALNGSGNDLNNVIEGNSYNNYLQGSSGNDTLRGNGGNDTLDGGTGDDYMAGGIGNDRYSVNSLADVVIEAKNAGTDTVISSIDYALPDNIENLTLLTMRWLTMEGPVNGSGNDGNNRIDGNTFNNILYGLGGNDTIMGGNGNDIIYGNTGADKFVFNSVGDSNADEIRDFNHADDTIILADSLDTGLPGAINSGILGLSFDSSGLSKRSYFEGPGETGNDKLEFSGIYVNTTDGNIYYNPTSDIKGDSLLLGSVSIFVVGSLDTTDFVYGVF